MLALREMVQSLFKAVRGGMVGVVFGHGRRQTKLLGAITMLR